MQHELDYIADDPAALRWAIGCVVATYRSRLADWLSFGPRTAWRRVAAGGALMLLIGFALLDNAGGQTAPPGSRPAVDETTCDLGSAPPASCRSGCADQLPTEMRGARDDHSKDDSCPSKSKTR
jgi:hypothetical protein